MGALFQNIHSKPVLKEALCYFSVLPDSTCRSPEETIRQQREESNHLDLCRAPDAHVPLPSHHPQTRKEGHKFDNGKKITIYSAPKWLCFSMFHMYILM